MRCTRFERKFAIFSEMRRRKRRNIRSSNKDYYANIFGKCLTTHKNPFNLRRSARKMLKHILRPLRRGERIRSVKHIFERSKRIYGNSSRKLKSHRDRVIVISMIPRATFPQRHDNGGLCIITTTNLQQPHKCCYNQYKNTASIVSMTQPPSQGLSSPHPKVSEGRKTLGTRLISFCQR